MRRFEDIYDDVYAAACLFIFAAAVLHAGFIRQYNHWPTSSLQWHMMQWVPLFIGAGAFSAYGASLVARVMNRYHSIFGWGGIVITPWLLAAAGYVIGYHIIFAG